MDDFTRTGTRLGLNSYVIIMMMIRMIRSKWSWLGSCTFVRLEWMLLFISRTLMQDRVVVFVAQQRQVRREMDIKGV